VSFFRLFITALLAAPLAALAQTKPAPDPADAAVQVPEIVYGSAFAEYRAFALGAQSPDKGWRDANRLVGELGGHAGNLAPAPDEEAGQAARRHQASPAGTHRHMH